MTPERREFIRRMFGANDPILVEALDAIEASEKSVSKQPVLDRYDAKTMILKHLGLHDVVVEGGELLDSEKSEFDAIMAIVDSARDYYQAELTNREEKRCKYYDHTLCREYQAVMAKELDETRAESEKLKVALSMTARRAARVAT